MQLPGSMMGVGERADEVRRAEIERRVEKDIDRVAFFSDAIFAIAITLLVLRISVPPLSEGLSEGLIRRLPSFLMYVVSFYVIGVFWLKHHKTFRYIRAYDHRLITLDLFLMMCIAFLPYPTELLGRHSTQVVAVVLYAATVVVTGVASTGIWWYAARKGFLDDELSREEIRAFTRSGLLQHGVFLISIPLAFIDPTVAMVFWASGVAIRPIDRYVARRRRARAKPDEGARPTAGGNP